MPNYAYFAQGCCHTVLAGPCYINKSCLAETVVGWLGPMVWLLVQARARPDWKYRLLSCPGSAAAVAVAAVAAEQLGAALALEQLEQP